MPLQGYMSDDDINVGYMDSGEESACDHFVLSSRSGTLFHLSNWNRVVEGTLGHASFSLVARRAGRITGVFPISWIRNRIFGDCLVSSPLAVYGGVCADDAESYYCLLEASGKLASSLGVRYVEMRNRTEPFASSLPGRDLYVTFTQDLTPGPEQLFQRLPRDTRYMIRKTLKSGLEWTDEITLSEFYEIFARSVHRLGTPVFPKKLFSMLQSEFPDRCRIFGVRKGKTAIAGVLCFYFKNQVLPYYSGSLPEYVKDSPNNFMYWSLIAQSCRENFQLFDFGRSKKGTGSYHFKLAWSMQVSDLPYRYQLVRAKEVPQMSPVDHKFQAPVALWKKLPFSVTKALGPRLIRWVPSV
jgi:FemAB-related protein (PEP-CTERM system-associated)